jgi:hypothetical protein
LKLGGVIDKFCSVVPEICRGQVHASRKERIIIIIIITRKIIIRNGAKTISPPNFASWFVYFLVCFGDNQLIPGEGGRAWQFL